MAELAKNFVCVRMQSMNGVNLNQFQFEYDLTWMAFFQNSSGHTYARYGGREDQGPETHLTKASLLRVMRQVSELHQENAVQVASKYEPVAQDSKMPSDLPAMKPMMAKRKESCIHCHDVKVAQLRHLRDLGQLQKEMIFTYPSPSNLGLKVDPNAQNIIASVTPRSPADVAGLMRGDVLQSCDGQRILTFADLTRVLELAPATGTLALTFHRDDTVHVTKIGLPAGWRKTDDPSWRPSVGVVGPGAGFWGEPAKPKLRRDLGLGDDDLAIRVTFIWAKHARETGIKNNDVVVSIDGQTNHMTMRQLHSHLQMNRIWGDAIPVVIKRNGKEMKLTMNLPSDPIE